MGHEIQRITFIQERDGFAAAREWVERTRHIYVNALANAGSHGSKPEYHRKFEVAVQQFEEWLREHP